MNNLFMLAIEKLEGGTYTIDTILGVIQQITEWAIKIGLSLAGVALVIGFSTLAIVDADRKQRTKHSIIMTLVGIVGIVIAISLVNIILGMFQ